MEIKTPSPTEIMQERINSKSHSYLLMGRWLFKKTTMEGKTPDKIMQERDKLAESIIDLLLSSQDETLEIYRHTNYQVENVAFPPNFELAVQTLIGNKMTASELLERTRWYTAPCNLYKTKHLYIHLYRSLAVIRYSPAEITEYEIKETLIFFLDERKIYVVPFFYHKISARNKHNELLENMKSEINSDNMPYGFLNHSRLCNIEVVSAKYFNKNIAVDYRLPQYFAIPNSEVYIDFTTPKFNKYIEVNTTDMKEDAGHFIKVYIRIKKSENIKIYGNAAVEIYMDTGIGIGFSMKCYTINSSHFTMQRDDLPF